MTSRPAGSERPGGGDELRVPAATAPRRAPGLRTSARNVTASATITFHRLTPRKAVIASARTRDGKTRRASIAAHQEAGRAAAAVPATRPTAVPRPPCPRSPTPRRPPSTTRAPVINWLSTSRPRGSVPERVRPGWGAERAAGVVAQRVVRREARAERGAQERGADDGRAGGDQRGPPTHAAPADPPARSPARRGGS